METPKFEITSICLHFDYSELPMNDAGMLITNAITTEIDPVHSARTIGEVVECYDDYEFVTRSKELYRITEFNNGTSDLYSESYEYIIMVCNILTSLGVHYYVTNIGFKINYDEKLEDVAQVFTNSSPNIAINEAIFFSKDKNDNSHSTTEFNCNLILKGLDQNSITQQTILNSIETCKAIYHHCEKLPDEEEYNHRKVVRVGDIIKMDFLGGDLSPVLSELHTILNNLNTLRV